MQTHSYWSRHDPKGKLESMTDRRITPTAVEITATETQPTVVDDPTSDTILDEDTPWVVLVWNDPINLMTYVVFVLQKLFGYSREKATELMLDVHEKGRAAVSNGTREKSELDVFRLHEYGLWATMQRD
jgi:ATP-dependent Clp protease adaptor protein ClpS